jgi:hypothetical protein
LQFLNLDRKMAVPTAPACLPPRTGFNWEAYFAGENDKSSGTPGDRIPAERLATELICMVPLKRLVRDSIKAAQSPATTGCSILFDASLYGGDQLLLDTVNNSVERFFGSSKP